MKCSAFYHSSFYFFSKKRAPHSFSQDASVIINPNPGSSLTRSRSRTSVYCEPDHRQNTVTHNRCLCGENERETDFRISLLMLCDLSSMADRTTIFAASSSRRQTLRETFNAMSLLLTEKKKKLFLCT